jgi:hypothetical protein
VVFDPECEGGPAGDPDYRLAHSPEDFGSEELGLGHGVKLVDGPLIDGASIVDCKCVSGCPECCRVRQRRRWLSGAEGGVV